MNLQSNSAIMGEAEKLFPQPSASSRDLDWRSPVPETTVSVSCPDFNLTRQCSACRKDKPLTDFAVDNSRPLGRTYVCRPCRNERTRNKYVPIGKPLFYGPPPHPPRDGDKKQARQRVNVLVRTKKIPPPNALPCFDCGHIHTPGERRHEYDHYLGYGPAHHLHVQPVCTNYHQQRGLKRGERKK